MAIPRVFVGSTCYDLKYIRGNLQYFINNLGYESVLSEEGDIFYDPIKHTHESCIDEVATCQLFVLIIGGRFGGRYKDGDKSITNIEYQKAISCKIPIFTLIEQSVYYEHHLYIKNKNNPDINPQNIKYPAVDNTNIFDFIDEVRKSSFNNAIQPFQDFSDIESYLKKQWAGLMFFFLSNRSSESRVSDVIEHLSLVSQKVEFISQQILNIVGTNETKIIVPLYDIMMHHESTRVLLGTGCSPTPYDILKNTDFISCANTIGLNLTPTDDETYNWTSTGEINNEYLSQCCLDYEEMQNEMKQFIEKSNLKIENILENK